LGCKEIQSIALAGFYYPLDTTLAGFSFPEKRVRERGVRQANRGSPQ